MGVCNMEARFLSSKASFGEVSGALLFAAEHRRGELHLPPFPHGETSTRLDGCDASGLQIRSESQPEDHAHQAAERCRRLHIGIRRILATVGRGKKAGAGAVPTASIPEVRRGVAEGFFGSTPAKFAQRF